MSRKTPKQTLHSFRKLLRAKWLRIPRENIGRRCVFHAEENGKRPEHVEKVDLFRAALVWHGSGRTPGL